MTSRELARLLDHTSKDSDRWTAADQMAIDQMLLQGAGEQRRPTLRFYVWSKPTLSLGYFQQAAWADAYLQSQMATADVALVRRSTGGGAILHDRELTYSLTWPNGVGGHSQTTGARDDLYRAIHDAVIRGLMEFEVRVFAYRDTSLKAVTRSKSAEATEDAFLCFQRRSPDDLICNGYKVLGSAQRRGRGALLQHGSLLLSTSTFAPALPGIAELTSRSIAMNDLVDVLTAQIGDALGLEFEPAALSPEDQAIADEIVRDRFGNEQWWRRR